MTVVSSAERTKRSPNEEEGSSVRHASADESKASSNVEEGDEMIALLLSVADMYVSAPMGFSEEAQILSSGCEVAAPTEDKDDEPSKMLLLNRSSCCGSSKANKLSSGESIVDSRTHSP